MSTVIVIGILVIGFALVTWRIDKMSEALKRLTTEVAELKAVNKSAVALITGLAGQIRDNAADEAALNRLADDLDAEADSLGAAVAANTPSSPETPDENPEPEAPKE